MPVNANTIPTGITNGAAIVLAIKSQRTTNKAPPIAEDIKSTLLSSPIICLIICGTINPINPSNPEKLTAAPASAAASTKKIIARKNVHLITGGNL